MLVFVDESGDAGMKLSSGSSAFFAVGLVTFDSNDEALACDTAISALRRKLSLPDRFEFHYVDNTERQQRAFLEEVTKYQFKSHTFALNKAKLTGPGFQYKDSLYKFAARKTFENARTVLLDATITIDGSGDRNFRRQFQSYLKNNINTNETRHVGKIKLQPAHQNNLLQLADYVASISGAHLHNRAMGTKYRWEFLRKHEATFRVWPP